MIKGTSCFASYRSWTGKERLCNRTALNIKVKFALIHMALVCMKSSARDVLPVALVSYYVVVMHGNKIYIHPHPALKNLGSAI